MWDAMRMSTACFVRAPQRYTSRLSKHFLVIFQEVALLSKTRNQLKCIEILQQGDILLVWRLDRLGRSMPHLVTLVEEL